MSVDTRKLRIGDKVLVAARIKDIDGDDDEGLPFLLDIGGETLWIDAEPIVAHMTTAALNDNEGEGQ